MFSYYNKTTIINGVLPWVILTPLSLLPVGQKLGYLDMSWTCSLCLTREKWIYRVLTLIEEVQSTYIRIYCVPLTPLPTVEKLTEETAFTSKAYKRRFILEPHMCAHGLGPQTRFPQMPCSSEVVILWTFYSNQAEKVIRSHASNTWVVLSGK